MTNHLLDSPEGRLAWARKNAGFKDAADFARVVKFNPTTYRSYEAGQNGYSRHAPLFAKTLNVTAEWLLLGGPVPSTAGHQRVAARPAPQSHLHDHEPRLPNEAVLTATFAILLDSLGIDPNEGERAHKLAMSFPDVLRQIAALHASRDGRVAPVLGADGPPSDEATPKA